MTNDKRTDHGIKITTKDVSRMGSENNRQEALPHLLSVLAWPYLLGAKRQVQRYKTAIQILQKKSIYGIQVCLHEFSCLFEDLATVARYTEMAGEKHRFHKLWLDVRNHIRHDIREEFDKTEKRKSYRAKTLGINPNLQVSIGFDEGFIKIGETKITLSDINDYLTWAEDKIARILNEAKNKGYIKGENY